ncbi:MAG TPA: maleylpyruvate isomerase N-terminal domain-containing protein [Planctomycetota bacterium]|nr:maleylpyruvate isomerase N-terminal domain-containing protein [Planctomycetota bacterium]
MDAARQEALFAELAAVRARFEGLLERADFGAWVNERTGRRVLDVVAHVAQWDGHAASSLEAYAAGDEFRLPAPFEIHAENQRIFEEHRGRSPREILAFLASSRGRLVVAARRIPPERWGGPVTYPWGAKGGVEELLVDMRGHDEHHGSQVGRAAAGAPAQPAPPRGAPPGAE